METKQASQSELGFSPDALAQRKAELLALLQQTAPELISDNQLDLERLKELLGEERIAPAEHYELNWAGKAAARREIQKTSSYTLLPDANNPNSAPHMLIEGENLEVLRVLQKSYYGKVKMIYIDPPYNTGNDSFVYPDNYSETLVGYQKRTGEKNEVGYLNKQSLWKKNSKESGQYHSAWLSMMYPRLYLARNLLREDGIIFISIDDNEEANLKNLCDEVFGAENFIACYIWQNKKGGGNDAKYCAIEHEYVLAYAKKIDSLPRLFESYSESYEKRYKEEDSIGRFFWDTFKRKSGKQYYPITCPDGAILDKDEYGNPLSWLRSEARFKSDLKAGEIKFEQRQDGWSVMFKQRMPEGKKPRSLILDKGTTSDGSSEILTFFGKDVFSNPT